MLHAELGWHPIQIDIRKRTMGFWLTIVNGKQSKLSKLLYTVMLKKQENVLIIRVSAGNPYHFRTY